jgi:hypothetical protein
MNSSTQSVGQFFSVQHAINGMNQVVDVSFSHDGEVRHVEIDFKDQGNGMGRLVVNNSADASCPLVIDSLVDLAEVQDASVDVDGGYCEIEFSAFVVIIHIGDDVDVEVMTADGEEYDVMESRSALAQQLSSILSGVAA